MKRLLLSILLGTVFVGLGGCVYDPAYYHRSGVVYDDGTRSYSEPYYDSYYSGGPYYNPGYYGYGYGYPYFGLGFSYYGGYGHGGHHHHHHHH